MAKLSKKSSKLNQEKNQWKLYLTMFKSIEFYLAGLKRKKFENKKENA